MTPPPISPGDRSAPWWRDRDWWRAAAVTYGTAAVSGTAAWGVNMPLPWMLGPFFACGALAALGVPLAVVPLGRETGQLAVGLAVGLRFTPATLIATLSLLPAMLGATVYVAAYTMMAAFVFRPIARATPDTAFFATAAGGVADMAVVAREQGADPSAVAMVHALRVSSTVAIVPLLVVAFGVTGDRIADPAVDAHAALRLLAAVLASFGAVWLVRRTTLPNPWLIGPMFLGILLGATGLVPVTLPGELIVAAQLVIGAWLGTRFRRDVVASLPRVALGGVAAALFMIAAAFAGALVLSEVTRLPVTTSFLALAPAAVTEMVITAKTMHLDAEIVTAFHVMRIFLVCSTILFVFRLYRRILERTGLDP